MILTGQEIKKEIKEGNIYIKPFNEELLNTNSLDIRISNYIAIYKDGALDTSRKYSDRDLHRFDISRGFTLKPGELYLANSIESTISNKYVPILFGKSSLARLGIVIHQTAGFGDIGWGYVDGKITYPTWTLEITVTKPVRIYGGMKIGQVIFEETKGEIEYYNGLYNHQKDAKPSDTSNLGVKK